MFFIYLSVIGVSEDAELYVTLCKIKAPMGQVHAARLANGVVLYALKQSNTTNHLVLLAFAKPWPFS